MLVGIDANPAVKRQRTGTETYAAEIIKALVAFDRTVSYRLYAKEKPPPELTDLGPNAAWQIMPFRHGWTLLRLSFEMMLDPPDVLFVPAHTLPLVAPKRSVIMIHDLGFDHFPDVYGWRRRTLHKYDVRLAKRYASHILTPSEFTRRDLAERYRMPLTKITCIHHGFDPTDQAASALAARPIPQPYFFFVGRIERKKNIERMLKAFEVFKRQTRLPHRLLLGGKPGLGYAEIRALHDAMDGINSNVEFLGYLSEDEQRRHLVHAEALLFPSLFEGFGMPVLEAFALRTPVITSDATSLTEVAGQAALLVDPLDVGQMAKAMREIATSPALREELARRGIEQCRAFSWERAAGQTLSVLRSVVAECSDDGARR